jgi:hypothetical protein
MITGFMLRPLLPGGIIQNGFLLCFASGLLKRTGRGKAVRFQTALYAMLALLRVALPRVLGQFPHALVR